MGEWGWSCSSSAASGPRRVDTALGDWCRNHLDHQLPALTGPDGTFRACETGHWGGDDDYASDPDVAGSVPPPDNRVWQTA